jgi:chromosome partitioning protein
MKILIVEDSPSNRLLLERILQKAGHTDLVSAVGVPANIVLNSCPPPTIYGEPHIVKEAREALKVYDTPVCDVAISQRVAFSHALIDGRAVSEYDRAGKAAREIDQLWSTLRSGMGL